MRNRILLLSLFALFAANASAQQLKTMTSYYDIMGTRPSEVYTIIAATGAKHGNYKTYTREGYVMLDCNFSNNELNGSYKEFFGENNSTQVRVSGNYVKGKKHGEWREWDQDGPGKYFLRWVTKYDNDEKLEQTRYYSDGKKWNYYLKDGVCTNWFDDGSKEEEWTNKNGRKNGVATTWATLSTANSTSSTWIWSTPNGLSNFRRTINL